MAINIFAVTLAGAGCGASRPAASPGEGTTGDKSSAQWVEGPHGKLRVVDSGSGGTPVILIHGLGGDRHVWDAHVARLRPTRRVVTLDLHGFGQSKAGPDAPFTVDSMVADVVAVMDALHLERAILVGFSFGGPVAAGVAGAKPERIAGVVFVDPAPDVTQLPGEVRAELRRMFASPEETRASFAEMLEPSTKEVKAGVLATLERTDPRSVKEAAAAMTTYDPKPALAAFKGPRLSILAANPYNEMPVNFHKIGGFEAQVIDGVGHWVMLDRPQEFAVLLDAFLAKLP
jgi:pimeloyl-ACP methyl ester carboxylesterase